MTDQAPITATATIPGALLATAAQAVTEAAFYEQIDSPEMAELAGSHIATLKRFVSQLDADRERLKKPFLEGGRGIDAYFKAGIDPLQSKIAALSAGLLEFQREQKKIADDAAAAERERLAKIAAEQKRIADEQAAKARREREEADRKQREADAKAEADRKRAAEERTKADADAKAEQEKLADELEAADPANVARIAAEMQAKEEQKAAEDAERQRLQKIADEEKAAEDRRIEQQRQEALQREQEAAERAASAAAPIYVAPAPVAKNSSVTTRDNWKGEGISLADAVRFIAQNPQHLNLLQFNDTAINQLGKATRGAIQIPGVRFFNDPVIAAKRGRS